MRNLPGISGIPNAVTRTLVCVDAVKEWDYAGTLHNPYLPEPAPFDQIKELVNIMERFFNDIAFPQAFFEQRSFMEEKAEPEQRAAETPHRYHDDDIFRRHTGSLATFELEVLFRQNATWQGSIYWQEKNERYNFRSTLEMMKSMDNAIQNGVLLPNL